MSFKIFNELNQMENFFPEFDMPINTEGNYHVSFRRDNNVIHNIFMHIADLVVLGTW